MRPVTSDKTRSSEQTAALQDTTVGAARTTRERIQAGLNMYLAAEARHARKVAEGERSPKTPKHG